jgi:hypothetical protein
MVAPRMCGSAAWTVPAVRAELSMWIAMFHRNTAAMARATETPVPRRHITERVPGPPKSWY